MAVKITFNTSFSGNGISVFGSDSIEIEGEVGLYAAPTLPIAQSAVLTTRTNDTSGSLTMADSGHGVTTGSRVDLYWTHTDGSLKQAYGAVVGTVAGTTVPIASVAGGDVLPAATTTIYVGITVNVPFDFDAANMTAITVTAGLSRGFAILHDGTYDLPIPTASPAGYLGANDSFYWHDELGTTNPLDGEAPTTLYLSHGDITRSITDKKVAVLIET